MGVNKCNPLHKGTYSTEDSYSWSSASPNGGPVTPDETRKFKGDPRVSLEPGNSMLGEDMDHEEFG